MRQSKKWEILSWTHHLAVVEDPTDHPLAKQVLAGAKKILDHKTNKKEPITPDILHRMYANFVAPATELPIIHTMVICLLGYAGFFRFSELVSLRECNVTFYAGHMEFLLNPVKQTNSGKELGYLLCTQILPYVCPISMLERYFCLGNIQGDTDKLNCSSEVLHIGVGSNWKASKNAHAKFLATPTN